MKKRRDSVSRPIQIYIYIYVPLERLLFVEMVWVYAICDGGLQHVCISMMVN